MRGSRKFRGIVCVGLALVLFAIVPGRAMAADQFFERVPSESLFCLRVNNLDGAIKQVEAFLQGLAPEGGLPTGMLRMQIAGLIGDPEQKHVRMDGTFGVFGVAGEQGQPAVALLIPVRSFEQLIEGNETLGQPDAAGVYKIMGGPDGKIPMAALARADKQYVLATWGGGGEAFAKLAKQVQSGEGTLATELDSAAVAEAGTTALWAYANVQRAAVMVRPFVEMGLAGMEAELKKAEEQGHGMAPTKIVGMYREIINAMFSQVQYVSVGIEPSAETLRISPTLVAVPGTDLADMLTASRPGRPIGLLEYLPNGAAMNFACRIDDKEGWKKSYSAMFDLFAGLLGQDVDQSNWAKIRDLTNESVDAMGDSMAFSMAVRRRGTPPFALTSVLDLDDPKAYQRVIDKEAELMRQGVYDDFYGWMGMETDFEFTRGVAEYRGVRIDAMKISFNTSGSDNPADQAIRAMYGDGLEAYTAVAGDKYIMAMGGNTQRVLQRLIGRVMSGRRRAPGSEIQQALAMVGGAEKNEFIMTLNIVRFMQMGMTVARKIAPDEADIPSFDGETSSSIVVAGRSSKAGRVELDVVVPKAHIQEIITAAKSAEAGAGAPSTTGSEKPM